MNTPGEGEGTDELFKLEELTTKTSRISSIYDYDISNIKRKKNRNSTLEQQLAGRNIVKLKTFRLNSLDLPYNPITNNNFFSK